MATLPGGWIADRLIGPRRAVLYGGMLIAAGHFSMAVAGAGDVLPRPVPDRDRHRPAQGQRQRDRRQALRAGRHPPRRRLLDLLHGHQPRRVHRAAGVRLPRPADQLALRLRRRRRRHDARRDSVRARQHATWATPACCPAPAHAGSSGATWRRQAQIGGGVLVALVLVVGVGGYTGLVPITATQVADAAGVFLLLVIVGFFGWLYFVGRMDARRAQAPLRHRRAVPRRVAVLVGVRAGRLDA